MTEKVALGITPDQMKEAIEMLHHQGALFPFAGIPDSRDFLRWKLELFKNGARTMISYNPNSQFKARMEGSKGYAWQGVALGWIDNREGISVPNHYLTLAPVFYDPDAYTPKALADFTEMLIVPEGATLYIPSSPIRLITFADSTISSITKAQILACRDEHQIRVWKDFLDNNALPPATEKEFAIALREARKVVEK